MIDMVAAKLTVYVLALLPAEDLSNPAPKAPTAGTATQINDLMSWGKWMAMVAGFAGLVIAGIMMAVGRRSRAIWRRNTKDGLRDIEAHLITAA